LPRVAAGSASLAACLRYCELAAVCRTSLKTGTDNNVRTASCHDGSLSQVKCYRHLQQVGAIGLASHTCKYLRAKLRSFRGDTCRRIRARSCAALHDYCSAQTSANYGVVASAHLPQAASKELVPIWRSSCAKPSSFSARAVAVQPCSGELTSCCAQLQYICTARTST
jgi:hypothetical protein